MGTEQQQQGAKARRGMTGTVTSTGGQKTIHVVMNKLVKHPVYGKYVRRRTKVAAHDPQDVAKIGDVVEIVPCRRLSKTKSWRLIRVIRQGEGPAAPVATEQEGQSL
jgi:small subunit ribosomal protein S17